MTFSYFVAPHWAWDFYEGTTFEMSEDTDLCLAEYYGDEGSGS
jgi:hypothetical protein